MKTTTVRRLRWTAPFVAGAAIAAAAILPGVAAGSDHPVLPPRTAAQLLADLATAPPPSLSGTVVETARLGLPELPSAGTASAQLSLTNLITGSHTVRVWLDGADRQRVALVGDLAESDLVHNATVVWVYSSSANAATHIPIPADSATRARAAVASAVPTPAQVADHLIAAITPTTRVTVDRTARVAGRAAYQIVLAPKDPSSLVTSVTIAIDAEAKIPLRVQVYGQNRDTPAFETAFTDITFGAPPASVFTFIPPTGASVSQGTLSQLLPLGAGLGRRTVVDAGPGAPASGQLVAPSTQPGGAANERLASGATRVIGSGWTAVLVTDAAGLIGADQVPAGSGPVKRLVGGGTATADQLISLLLRSATAVPHGRLIKTALVTILISDDGHLYIGAVDGAALQRVAATGQPA